MLTSRTSEAAHDAAPSGSRCRSSHPSSSLARLRAAGLGVACAATLLLSACASGEAQDGTTPGTPESSSPGSASPEGSEAPTGGEDQRELPDPDAMDIERDEELGGFLSEEEACMAVGTLADGLGEDLDGGIGSEEDLEEAYQAVEQTYLYVPEELRAPLEEVLAELDAEDPEDLDEETVLSGLEELDGWVDETCDGEYHNQDHGEIPADPEEDGEA